MWLQFYQHIPPSRCGEEKRFPACFGSPSGSTDKVCRHTDRVPGLSALSDPSVRHPQPVFPRDILHPPPFRTSPVRPAFLPELSGSRRTYLLIFYSQNLLFCLVATLADTTLQ